MLITRKNIFNLGEGFTQGLDNTMLTAEKKNRINLTGNNKNFCLSLHYNRANSYLFVNGVEIYKFKAKHCEIPLYLGNTSEFFSVYDI